MVHRLEIRLALAALVAAGGATAQKPPAVRALGPIVRVSTEPLASVATAVPLADGRVYVNDVASRRVLLFDSTLAKVQVAADSTSVTSKAYGVRPGTLIAFHGDSVLLVDPASTSMVVLGPSGKVDRVMAMPRPGTGAPFVLVGPAIFPAFDASGRLVSFVLPGPPANGPTPPHPGKETTVLSDSNFLARFDLASRTFDTVGVFRAPKQKLTITRDEDLRLVSMEVPVDVLPILDDWAVLHDGTIAIVRGRDYHVEWRGQDGHWTASAKMPFEWQHLDDAMKTTLIDSSMAATKARRDSMMTALQANPPPIPTADGARGGGRGGGGGGAGGPPPAMIDGRPSLNDLPDYRPPFLRGASRGDADGNLWIRTTTMVKGQPVYDIVNRTGELVDRVLLPAFRTIAGFGPGVVYMAVKDAAGVVHLERARVR